MTLLKHRVLVIAPQPFFAHRGTPFSVYYRTMIMSEMDFEIDLLTYGEGQDVDLPNVTIHRIPFFPQLGRVRIGPSVHKLFLDFFIFFATFRLLMANRYDLVHAHEEAVFFSRFLKPIFRFKLIYDMHSCLPQQLTNFEFTTSKLTIGIFRLLEKQALKAADAVITICPDLADYVNSVITDRSKHIMIENSLFDPVKLMGHKHQNPVSPPDEKIESLLPNLSSETSLIVYAGTLEPYQGIDILIEAFQIVHGKIPNTSLLIMGGTPAQVSYYQKLTEKLSLEQSVFLTGNQPQQVVRRMNRRADLLVSPRKSGTNTPLKIYEQLASGTPLLATDIYSHTQAIDDRVAFLVAPNPSSMAKGIQQALTNKEERLKKSQAAQKLFAEKYHRNAYEKKLRSIIQFALGNRVSLVRK